MTFFSRASARDRQERVAVHAGQDGRDREPRRVEDDALAVLAALALRSEPVAAAPAARGLPGDLQLHPLRRGKPRLAQVEVHQVYVELALRVEVRARPEPATARERHLRAAAPQELAQGARQEHFLRGLLQRVDAALAHAL